LIDIEGLKMDFKERSNWVAIIGSREASDEELEAAYKLGKICAKKGKIVVSGLAKGIDRAGHEGAIDGGGLTIALVSTPIFMPIYPHENKDLAEKIKKHGCIIHLFNTKPQWTQKGFTHSQKRLVERSILNAYACPNIVVVKNSSEKITGGTRWATNYGKKIGHNVYRYDCNGEWHKDPEVEECKIWWEPELNFEAFLVELSKL